MQEFLYRKIIRKWFAKQINAEIMRAVLMNGTYIVESSLRKAPDSPNFPHVQHQIVPHETSEEA